jgi:hypothetical protein
MEQMEGKVEQLLRDIGVINGEMPQIATLRTGFQDRCAQVIEIDFKLGSMGALLQTVNLALQGT